MRVVFWAAVQQMYDLMVKLQYWPCVVSQLQMALFGESLGVYPISPSHLSQLGSILDQLMDVLFAVNPKMIGNQIVAISMVQWSAPPLCFLEKKSNVF